MNYGTITEEKFNKLIEKKEIKNVVITHVAKNGTKTFEATCKCDFCNGTGFISYYAHHDNGICYCCNGTGYHSCKGKVATAEQIAMNEENAKKRAEKKKQIQQETYKQICEEHPVENKAVASWLSSMYRNCRVFGISGETEKAYKVILEMPYGLDETFIPKSALVEYEDPTKLGHSVDLVIKDWFIKKNFYEDQKIISFTVIKESEKAYYCNLLVHDDSENKEEYIKMWIPKKCMETKEEHKVSEKKNAMSNEERYEALVAFAKENGIKGIRSKMRVSTILAKIEDAGLSYIY